MKKLITFYLLITCCSCFAQIIIHGTVTEAITNKAIENAHIYFRQDNISAISDSAGKFTIDLTATMPFSVSHLAYEEVSGNYEGTELHIIMQPKNNLFPEVIITDTRADYYAPLTTTNIKGKDLNANNFGEDMPQLLEFTPSVVVTSDAGNGVGYTGIRIRGSDATRINVTINGVPYNDAESQQTYWVDINDIAESTDDIQVQRGVGSSVNGISSFGGSVNINTNELEEEPYATVSLSAGSFNLFKGSASFGSGRLHDHWFMEGRISRITSDGFIDRSFADLYSFALTSAYKAEKFSSIFNIFSGKERTYQSWGGVPKDSLTTNRTYNPYTYEDQTDNYLQTHYQWHNIFYLKNNASLKLTLNYTRGKGYYEQLETEQAYADYGVPDLILSDDTITFTDMVTQKWLGNDYYGAFLQYENEISKSLALNFGAAAYTYEGSHFGKVIWAEYAQPFGTDHTWYSNTATKKDADIFAIMRYSITDKLLLYTDLQLRTVHYDFLGPDAMGNYLDQNVDLLFFNPKLGISYAANTGNLFSLALAETGHEPNSDDYTETSPLSRPSPEYLYDAELSWKHQHNGWQLYSTLFYMYYLDQLVLTGEINDVGAYTRTNIPVSFRRGLELAWAKTFFSKIAWNANLTLSENKIQNYTEFLDNWDTGEQVEKNYTSTNISFSPALTAGSVLTCTVFEKSVPEKGRFTTFTAGLQSKYVGMQYIDNTGNPDRSLDSYSVEDIILSLHMHNTAFNSLTLSLSLQNVLDAQYESNAWVYPYIYESEEAIQDGYFPQAGRNFAIRAGMRF